MNIHACRLLPGSDLRSGLEDFLKEKGIDAAALVSCVGSLRSANLRLAGASSEQQFQGPFEIVSSEGTLSTNGCHIHIAIADKLGKVHGGHLCYGSEIYTTAELVLLKLDDHEFLRQLDNETGYKELLVREIEGSIRQNK